MPLLAHRGLPPSLWEMLKKSVVLESPSTQEATCCVCHRLFELKGTSEVIGPNLPSKAGRLSKNVLASSHRVLRFKGSLGAKDYADSFL